MRGSVSSRLGIVGAAVVCACTPHRASSATAPAPDVRDAGGVTILSASLLQNQTRSLIEVMKARVPSMEVVDDQPCPDIFLRGRSTITTVSNPAIYVDGQRASNTCVLDMMSVTDLQRVEIYPNGQPRAGYQSNPYGVILIFLKTAD